MRILTSTLATGAVAIACGGTSSGPASSSPQGHGKPQAAGACGVRVFQSPACQQALDSVCCPLSTRCGNDPGCAAFSDCVYGCKVQSGGRAQDNCVNGCGTKARATFCERSCAGQDSGCLAVCTKQGSPNEPMITWMQLADCSKGVNYPESVTCNDNT